jgi:hypothetical protein
MSPDPGRPFADLDPQRVLEALASEQVMGDGRLLALNSYENRVYLVYLDDGSSVVAKFYRPARWSDAQILEGASICPGACGCRGAPRCPQRCCPVARLSDISTP